MSATAWCPTCRSRRTVTDQHDESYYEGPRELGYIVTDLSCGHESVTEARIIGASPGGESAAEALAEQDLRRRQEAWG